LIFLVRLFFIQVVDTSYKLSAENNSQREEIQYPARGLIFDRNKQLLVENQAAYDLMIVPRQLSEIDTTEFCYILKISKTQFDEKLKAAKRYSRYKPSIFLKQISAETYAILQEKIYKFSGFFVQTRTLRKYPQGIAAHILGYVSEVDEKITKSDSYYKSGDYIGKSGLEESYEKELRGKKGRKLFLVDVHNRVQGIFHNGDYDTKAEIGSNIYTGIDAELQAYGEKLMKNKIGSVVAMEPSSGEILALVSVPAYDPNLLVGRIRSENFKQLSHDSLKPLFNRALLAQYSPGSTFKPVNGLVGLQENVVFAETKYSCQGEGSYPIACSHFHYSPVNLSESIELSCNPYHWNVFKTIIEKPEFTTVQEGFNCWRNHITSFGFGSKLNIDLPSESSGNIPVESYFNKYYGEKGWRATTIRSLSIGQGEILSTPLQLTNEVAIIANKGFYYTPHIVRKIENVDTAYYLPYKKNITTIDSSHFDIIIDAMHDVFIGEHGTARWYPIKDIELCGKTGTVENPHGANHSVFIAFAPKENPKIAISVVVENSGFGSTWAAPIACLMIEKYLTDTVSYKWRENKILDFNYKNIEKKD
jgi:penicillin-binding protein 2